MITEDHHSKVVKVRYTDFLSDLCMLRAIRLLVMVMMSLIKKSGTLMVNYAQYRAVKIFDHKYCRPAIHSDLI